MRKSIMFILILMTLSMVSSAMAYHWVCLTEGESINNYVCHSWCCKLCVTEGGFSTKFDRCYGLPNCQCGGNSGASADTQPPEINILEPANNTLTSSTAVRFKIFLDEKSTLTYLDSMDIRHGYKRMCSSCTSFNANIRFKEGTHLVTIRATDKYGNTAKKNVTFTIDSKIPRIRATYPKNGDYANGLFSVVYDEDSLVAVRLYYKQAFDTDYHVVELTNCTSGTRQECSILLNGLSDGELRYKFEVTDRVTSVQSDEKTVIVDTTPPTLIINYPQNTFYNKRSVDFDINVLGEANPVQLGYIDQSLRRPRYKSLCKKCLRYMKRQSFKDGKHNLTIMATDLAGNIALQNVVFIVDSKKPRISRTYPAKGKYTNGTFTVVYSEDNPVEITLNYKQDNSVRTLSKSDCPGGRNQKCIFKVNSLSQGEVSYNFTITDIAGTKASSRTTTAYVDTIAPIMIVYKPVNGTFFDRRVPFTIDVLNEKVTLEYMDYSSSRPRYRVLCRRCNEYNRVKTFPYGVHSLIIKATDNAGNSDSQAVEFNLVKPS